MIKARPQQSNDSFQGWEGWTEFCEFIQKTEGYMPNAGDSSSKHQFRIFQQGMNHAGMGWHDFVVNIMSEAKSWREIAIDTESETARVVAETLEELLEKAGIEP